MLLLQQILKQLYTLVAASLTSLYVQCFLQWQGSVHYDTGRMIVSKYGNWKHVCLITLVNKDFVPWGKLSVSDVFLDTEFKYVSRISVTHTFCCRLKGWNLLRQDTNVCFYRGRHEELMDFFSQEDGIVFGVMFVLLWKFLAINITQIIGTCSLIRQKWAWRWFYSTTYVDSLPFLWLMQPTWRKVMKAWSYC